jgi:hypothetical protein
VGPVIVELTDHRGRLRHRVRLPAHRFVVGRAWDCDLVLDDPWADPHHLELARAADGSVGFTDLGSLNGTWQTDGGPRVARGVVTPGLALRVGRSVLRFIDPARPVPAARPDTGPGGGAALARHPVAGGLAVAGAGVAQAVATWLETPEAVEVADLLTPALLTLLAAAAWAGGWAVATRLTAHRFRFGAHLAWAAALFLASAALGGLTAWVGFLWPALAPVDWAAEALHVGLAAVLVAGHLALVVEWPAPRRWRTATLVTVAGYATILAVGGPLREARDGTTAGAWVLRPLDARLIPAGSPDAFFDRAAALRGQVDRLVEAEER